LANNAEANDDCRAAHHKAPIPGKKIVHCRRAQLPHCQAIARASRRAIRLESSNPRPPDLSIRDRLAQETSKRSTQALANRETGQLAIFYSRG
jgi:hypothetical protein